MAENNLGLVHLCANRFKGRGIEYDDLYSAGCVGLLKAVKAFDEGRGVKFSTYAVPVILGEIKRMFRDGGSVKVSRSLKEMSLKISREREKFIKAGGREPLISELAEIMETDEYTVSEALAVAMPPLSLSFQSDDEDDCKTADIPVPAPDSKIVDILAVRQLMKSLPPTDRIILEMRYYRNCTQSETAKALGMSQVQISRKEKKLLTSLRQQLLS